MALVEVTITESLGFQDYSLESEKEYSGGSETITRIFNPDYTVDEDEETTWERTEEIEIG